MSKPIQKNKPISSATAGNYAGLLADIKQRIRTAQVRTAMAGNASMLMLYWEIGGGGRNRFALWNEFAHATSIRMCSSRM